MLDGLSVPFVPPPLQVYSVHSSYGATLAQRKVEDDLKVVYFNVLIETIQITTIRGGH